MAALTLNGLHDGGVAEMGHSAVSPVSGTFWPYLESRAFISKQCA